MVAKDDDEADTVGCCTLKVEIVSPLPPKTLEELDDPLILIYENKISSVSAVVKVMELALKRQRPLLTVAEDVDSKALATLILNMFRAGIQICAVKAPGFGENRKQVYMILLV